MTVNHALNHQAKEKKPIAPQRIIKIRRDYNIWVADETLEDYALRFTPRSMRKWSIARVANTAYGAVAFLALEAIGGTIALNYGFTNAVCAILVVSLIIFLSSLPISYYCSRYAIDMDLLTRGAGFGYLGSTLTSLIYASFTFILFAIEASIMAMALKLYFDMPLPIAYLVSALVVVPIAMRGITMISRLHVWTLPLWLILMITPFVFVLIQHPTLISEVTSFTGFNSDHTPRANNAFNLLSFGAASTLIFALIAQVGEQADYLRFLPEKTKQNKWRWNFAMMFAGPGWIFLGVLKMLGGVLLMYLALQYHTPIEHAAEPAQMYWIAYTFIFSNPQVALAVTVLLVVISQIKINVTNAYAGSLAWSNFFSRLTHSHPGRVVWLVFNVLIAILLMEMGVFRAIEQVLGLYANLPIAWIGTLVADLVINKPLGLSPKGIEFRRAYLFDVNPVGVISMVFASILSITAFCGVFGETTKALASFIALGSAMLCTPLIAWLTKGRYYIARKRPSHLTANSSCCICEKTYESEDMAHCPAYSGPICSLCCSLDVRCHDLCKPDARLAVQFSGAMRRFLPRSIASKVNTRLGIYILVVVTLSLIMGAMLGLLYIQEIQSAGVSSSIVLQEQLRFLFIKIFALLFVLICVGSWWLTLTQESRSVAQSESNRQTSLLMEEISAHQETDTQLQAATKNADSANRAKSRYITGISHEIRTPLNSILGYAQLLMQDSTLSHENKKSLDIIKRSGSHLVSLVDGLLDLASIESGKLKLETIEINLPIFIQQIISMFQPQAADKGIRFISHISEQLPIFVRVDQKRLEQILINILGNAIKFTQQGEVVLRVYYRSVTAIFEIQDSGCGIPEHDLQRIFSPFERGGGISANSPSVSGTGLGLTISKLLTDLLGGELTVSSTLDVGSTFQLRLFLPAVRLPQHIPLEDVTDISGYRGERLRILVVDNEPNDRELLSKLLSKLGFIVQEAVSGIECLRLVAEFQPALIIMDINMPMMDGWQTSELLRRNHLSFAPILIVSANAFERGKENSAGIAESDFLAKPIDFTKLLDKIHRVLDLEWISPSTATEDAHQIIHEAHSTQEEGILFEDHIHQRDNPLPSPVDINVEIKHILNHVLSQDDHQSLVDLAHMGYVRGLLNTLDHIEAQQPEVLPLTRLLRECAIHFRFPALIRLLKTGERE
ncbi:ATP-binding protein [Aquirhabdus sp.]|uniref:hybrid sensor histidine kinase/response regulator n=1 Tax=Aquirhabdus sp. TaxID=2824160 RepID=UPI00396C41F4